ncbi:MAG: hypothetical protein A4E33_01529 [Methanoregula sp. PtaB.Bin085]|nr:MAG: hypothetical protein A4E33_01529 [Methanoregula sp. PtaB.Bin085]
MTAETSRAQSGTSGVRARPEETRTIVIRPSCFWESLAALKNAISAAAHQLRAMMERFAVRRALRRMIKVTR